MNYCESPKKKKSLSSPKGHRKKIAEVLEKIKVKSERYKNLKKALYIANCDNNKKYTDDVEDMDLDEFQVLLGDGHVPQNEDDICNERSSTNDKEDDDCFELPPTSNEAEPSSITNGANQMPQNEGDICNERSSTNDKEDDDSFELPPTNNEAGPSSVTIGANQMLPERSPFCDREVDDCIEVVPTSNQAEPNSTTIGANQMPPEHSPSYDGEDDDCVEVLPTGNQRTERIAITIGVNKLPLEIDENFSCQYSYTTDVR